MELVIGGIYEIYNVDGWDSESRKLLGAKLEFVGEDRLPFPKFNLLNGVTWKCLSGDIISHIYITSPVEQNLRKANCAKSKHL